MEQHNFDLIGYRANHTPTLLGKEVFCFATLDKKMVVSRRDEDLVLVTKKGRYTLKKHASLNLYQGQCDGIKVHVSLKKIIGKLVAWY